MYYVAAQSNCTSITTAKYAECRYLSPLSVVVLTTAMAHGRHAVVLPYRIDR